MRSDCEIRPSFFCFEEVSDKAQGDASRKFYLSQIKISANASRRCLYKNNFIYFVKHFTENVWRIKIKALYLHQITKQIQYENLRKTYRLCEKKFKRKPVWSYG